MGQFIGLTRTQVSCSFNCGGAGSGTTGSLIGLYFGDKTFRIKRQHGIYDSAIIFVANPAENLISDALGKYV
jgi:hypothetical protein